MFDANTKTQFKMENVINLGIPHVGEQIFANLETETLVQCFNVSQTWRVLARPGVLTLLQEWKGKMFDACKTGKSSIVKLLLKHFSCAENGLNVVVEEGFKKRTPFIVACENGHSEVVQLLLSQSKGNIELNAKVDFGRTGFMLACEKGHKDVVKLLLKYSVIDIEF